MSISRRARKKYASSIDLDSLFKENALPPPLSPSKWSFRPPANSLPPLPNDDYSFKPRESIPKSNVHGIPAPYRLNDRSRRHTTIIGPGVMLSQKEGLPRRQPQNDKETEQGSDPLLETSQERPEAIEEEINYDYDALADHFNPGVGLDDLAQGRERYYRKKHNQWKRWNEETIPRLIPIYHGLLESTSHWRDFPTTYQPTPTMCSCNSRTLKVLCIQWQDIHEISIPICECTHAAEILLKYGYFPCAPIQPSLAVEIRMLEFIRELFLRISPNNTAWCEALETVLTYRGISLPGKSTFRKRFANAVFWFNHLLDRSNQYLETLIDDERRYIHDSTTQREVTHTANSGDMEERNGTNSEAGGTNPFIGISEQPEGAEVPRNSPDRPDSLRASYYLRARCPLCFGGDLMGSELPVPDIITQIDACFGQCRRDIGRDPPLQHSHSHFVSEDSVESMRIEVEARRPPNKVGPDKRKRPIPLLIEDRMEPIGLPTSVLDACEKTFEAADERRQKASTRIFKDTGLMVLLCRHDRVLFVANMQTAGEKQFYVLALLKALFQQLPPKATVGLLYDIGCAIHRSITKWNFLPEYQNRMVFGLSIFHAYGHEWPCQLRYAPRLTEGFGLSNGEGCERFWSSIKALIPNLRISGHHRRLYTLDMQIDFLDFKASPSFGSWITKQYNRAENMILDGTLSIEQSQRSEGFLREQWKEQLEVQIKPLPNQNQRRGKTAVEATLAARERLRISEEELRLLKEEETRILQIDPTSDLLDEMEIKLQEATRQRDLKQQLVEKLERSLGVVDRQELRRLKKNKYLQLRMNARALKQRLRDRLRQRKFELARVERSYRHSVNERKLVDHAEGVINKRIGTITETARAYNNRCKEIATMIAKKQAPRWASAPEVLDLKSLFSLDVDHEIWQDVGLEDGSDGPPPAWLGDIKTRSGIRGLLDRDRALEERNRLVNELRNMQTWIDEELQVLNRVLERFEDSDAITYGIKQRQSFVLSLRSMWSAETRLIPVGTWSGITSSTENAIPSQRTPSTTDDNGNESGDDDEAEEDELMEDEGLLEAVEILQSARSTEQGVLDVDNDDDGAIMDDEYGRISKRPRIS